MLVDTLSSLPRISCTYSVGGTHSEAVVAFPGCGHAGCLVDAESQANGGTSAIPRTTTFAVIGGDSGLSVSLEAVRSRGEVRLDLTGFLGATDGELEIDCTIDGQQPVTFNTVKPLT